MKTSTEIGQARAEFAHYLKAGRETLWISQARMAELLRVPLRRYQHWEARESMPRDEEPALVREKIAAFIAGARTPWNDVQ